MTPVDTEGKVSDTVLEIVTGDLHDVYGKKKKVGHLGQNPGQDTLTRIMLDDGNLGVFRKLPSGVAETVPRSKRKRKNDQRWNGSPT